MDKAVKGLHGLTAELDWDELVCSQKVVGSGKFYVNFAGQARADVAGDNPRTLIAMPPFLYIYKPLEGIAERYYLPSRPDLLGQYALLGFIPAGSDLKKDYKVTLVKTEELDSRKTVVLNLVPKSEEIQAAISAIVLWVDQATWMPYQQLIRHNSSGMQATIRFTKITSTEDISNEVFQKVWPPETKIVAD
jgi:outer membrane lipoprotein-sorting protein